ncbi:MAG TPA: 50S ribosomal protein L17 [Acidobacteriota bacterium]|nr:50S ribosomal protein L17 [Acidobacteriota bacterium]
MRHRKTVKKLGRTTAHRRALLGNMATALFRAHALVTTTPKARVLRSVAEKLITLGKRGDLHARRLASRRVRDRAVLSKLFDEIAPQFATRPGGYTRIIKLGQRRGDGAHMSKLELLVPKAVAGSDEKTKKAADKKKKESTAAAAKSRSKKKAAADE